MTIHENAACKKEMNATAPTGACWFMICLLLLTMGACKKDGVEPAPDPGPVDTTAATGNFYKLIRIENFGGDTAYSGPVDGARSAIYFSLEDKKGAPELYEKSTRWDITFSGIANAFIKGNNGKNPQSFGFGSSGVGGVYITDKPFEEVTTIPADSEFKTEIALDENGAFGTGVGWVLYDWGGTEVADGSYDKEHVAYALGVPLKLNNGKTLVRTLIVKTARGHYARLKMISLYKNAFTPGKMFRKTEYPYFTFEYVMVPKGSTRFEIK